MVFLSHPCYYIKLMKRWYLVIGVLTLSLLLSFTIPYAVEEVEYLLQRLRSDDPDEREEAVEALGQYQDPNLIEPLVEIMLKQKSGEVRSAAAIVLFRMGNEKSRDAFLKALKDPDISVRLIASGALYKFGDPKALDLLAKALKDPSQEIRFSAVAILSELGDAKSIELLKTVLQDPDQDIRDLAQETLEMIASTLLQAVKTDNPPVVDGVAEDPAWAQARPLQVATEIKAREGPTVTLKALQKDSRLYLLAIWKDASQTESIQHRPWIYNGTTWELGKEEEDRLAIIFPITPIPPFSTADKGCTAMCHKAKAMHTNTPAELADLWIWRAARSNPVGQADDWMLGPVQDPNSDGRKPDAMDTTKIKIDGVEAYRHGYTPNIQEQENRPLFMLNPDKEQTGLPVLLAGEAVAFNPKKKYNKGDLIPGYLVAPFTGSRGDIQAKGVYKDGIWTVEFSRAFNTGHPDDIKLEEGKEYFFSLKVFDDKEFATAKEVYKLRF